VFVDFVYENENYKIFDETTIRDWIVKVIEKENKIPGEIYYNIISDEEILKINKEFLKHDYFTDIITFDQSLVNIINGDIFISFDTVQSNSKIYEKDIFEEMCRVIIHGIMHLCGYGDKTDSEKKEMRQKEDFHISYLDRL